MDEVGQHGESVVTTGDGTFRVSCNCGTWYHDFYTEQVSPQVAIENAMRLYMEHVADALLDKVLADDDNS